MGAIDTDTGIKEEIRDEKKEEEKMNSDETKEEVVEEKKKQKNEPNMFVKVKERFSKRSKKKKKDLKDTVSNEEIINEKALKDEHSKLESEQTSENDEKLSYNEATNEQDKETNEDSKEKQEEENKVDENTSEEQIVEEEKKKKSEPNVFIRVKERLSKRSKKKKSEAKHDEVVDEKINDNASKESEVENELVSEQTPDENDTNLNDEKITKLEKEENFFQKLLKRFSFRSKKKKEKGIKIKDTEDNETTEEIKKESDTKHQDDTKSLSSVDEELSEICKDDVEEQAASPTVPIMNSSRPPLPSMRRPPSSATSTQSRPVSQLDAALKQFKVSTAASRENLRSSRVDISPVEEKVKTLVTSRPSTPTPAGWRSRAPPENTNLADQWAKLSSSMTDLR